MAGGAAGVLTRRQRDRLERAIDALPESWVVLRDVRWPGRPWATIDQIAIGPGGVFVIESRNWPGQIVTAGDVLRHNGRPRRAELLRTREMAAAVSRRLAYLPTAYVIPVLCIVGSDAAGWAGEVAISNRARIVEMLTARPEVLAPEVVSAIAGDLRTQLQNEPAPRPAPRSEPVRREGPRASLTAPVAGLVFLAAVAASPTVMTGVAHGVDTIVNTTVDSGAKPADAPKRHHRPPEMADRP